MKDGMRFVDSDMHIQEPGDLFMRYLDPAFKSRVSAAVDAKGHYQRSWTIDGIPAIEDLDLQAHRKRPTATRTAGASVQPIIGNQLSGSRVRDTDRLRFAIDRGYDAEAQVMAFDMEGIDIAVLFPTGGLNVLGRDGLDPQMSLALSQAYNNWIHDFCAHSPDQLKWAAMLPVHDVNLACEELRRCVQELGAVGSFIRPSMTNGRYWHANYWDPLYSMHEELDVAWGFHEGPGAWNSPSTVLYGENRFYRHVAAHWIEMQQAMIAQIIGGVFEFHPKLRVAYLEANSSWAPGLLSRIEWDYENYHDTHAPYLSLTPKEYFQRNCWASIEGTEPEVSHTAELIGAENLCVSSDYPHFDSDFPNVSNNVIANVGRETAAKIFMGGAALYGFTDQDFAKADAAAAERRS
jgi:predicted TIM-barrel fold metal-dependent hydrolase